ncbi:MAG: SAM-dependent methyltransferase [Gammaproteobacteria bacterium HGW-Gammaproteobacteria-6]|nr:MAG: SAM-dependent methyltransferase [Gammaproteobacteria bacterium HGW-Gammaproteobacteria-6]
MPGYTTRLLTVRLGGHDFRIRALSDRQQFADPDHLAERAGISSAQWCLFGQVWPAGRLLAQTMSHYIIAGKRILEIGCGLGLASLVLQRRHANITASDHHPLAESFLNHNAALNGLDTMIYRDMPWAITNHPLPLYDLIIGSDILYERGHADLLAVLVQRHGTADGEVLITDPGRGNSSAFTRKMAAQGYTVTEQRSALDDDDKPPFRGHLLSYRHA